MANHLRSGLVLDALEMAIGQRRPSDVIHHSDQGSQYTSLAFGGRCREAGVRPSIGSVGDAYDNAMCESFFATLACELIEAAPVCVSGGSQNGLLQLYRRLVQSCSAALRVGLPLADGLRSDHGDRHHRTVIKKPSNAPRKRGSFRTKASAAGGPEQLTYRLRFRDQILRKRYVKG